MFRQTYTNAYEGELENLFALEQLLQRSQTEMNGGKPDITV